MKKAWNRLIAVSLSLMLMFTMGLNVFAAENVEGAPSDDPAVTLDEGDGAATLEEDAAADAEAEVGAMTQEELSEVPEVTAMDTEPASTSLDEVLASIGELSNDPREFTANDVERVEAIQKAYEALSAEDQATVDSTFDHPSGDGQSYGRVLEAAVWAVRSYSTDVSTTLTPGTYTTTTDPAVSSESSKGKSDSSRTRNWWVESIEVSETGQATAKIYVTSGDATAKKLTSYPSVWAGGNTYEKDSDNNYSIPVDLNGTTYFGGVSSSMPRPIMYSLSTTIEEPAAEENIDLEITNNTGMFKAVSAYLTKEDDQEYLVMALSGSGYTELFKGTYEQAVANGDGTEANGNDSWIHGYTNAEGKLEFKVPMGADETYVPVVSVSKSYYDKFRNGENTLQRAFYPRQFTLDRDAKTLVTGDYEYTQELAVTNNIKMFKTPAAKISTVGGPNSNSYKSELVLTMQNDSYNKMFVGTGQEASAAETTIDLTEDMTFTVPVRWVETFGQPETMKTLVGEPFRASFFSKKNKNWLEREITINEEDGTIIFNDAKADYSAVDAAIATVPKDLSVYTEETSAAVTEAVNAVVRDKNAADQADVDKMAEDIVKAVKALRIDLSGATVNTIAAQTYTGKALAPKVTVKLGDQTLVNGTDYTVAYANNVNAGTAKVTISGKGGYIGSAAATFKINPAAQKLTMSAAQKTVKFKKLKKKAQTTSKVAVGGAKTKVTYTKVGGSKKLTINKNTGKITVKKKTKKGTYKITVRVTAAKSANYKAATVTKTIKVKVKK